jgi:hypothetical protein
MSVFDSPGNLGGRLDDPRLINPLLAPPGAHGRWGAPGAADPRWLPLPEAGRRGVDQDRPTGGGNFNPGIKIDTSHVSVAPPYTGPKIPDFSDMHSSDGLSGPGVSGGPRPTYYTAADADTKRTSALQKDVDRWLEHVHPRGDEPFIRAGVNRIAAAHGIKLTW